jgi:hypothetical protein
MAKKKKVTARNEVERVQRLLALFDKTKGTPEGERAREKADLLLSRHGWNEGEVRNTSRVILKADALDWRQMLLSLCAEHLSLEIQEDDNKSLVLQGLSAAIEDAERLFRKLDKKISEASVEFAEDLSFHPSRNALLEQGFATCAVLALSDRMIPPRPPALLEVAPPEKPKAAPAQAAEGGPGEEEPAAEQDLGLNDRIEQKLESSLKSLTEDEDEFCTEGFLFGQQLPLFDALRRSVAGLLPISDS